MTFSAALNDWGTKLGVLLVALMVFGLIVDRWRGRPRDIRETLLNISILVIGLLIQFLVDLQWRDPALARFKFPQLFDFGGGPLVYILAFLATDFVYYWFHRMLHTYPFFWSQHCIHHSSTELNLSTAGRLSWTTRTFEWLAYLPSLIIGFPLHVLITVWTVNLFIQSLSHISWVPKLGVLDLVFNTPSNHRVHHGENPEYLHRNFGATLIIWDRIFGTFSPEQAPVIYGCGYRETSKNPFVVSLRPVWKYLTNRFEIGRGDRI